MSMKEVKPNGSPPKHAAHQTKLKWAVAGVAAVLLIGFVIVFSIKADHEKHLKTASSEAIDAHPIVAFIKAEKAPADVPLSLPGETSAWFESTIYARVDGYVGNWTADIGDKVVKGQVLATIETPDLDAQLTAAQAKLKSGRALVEFAKSTYERWKDSPKGVVSDQERESKKADYDTALAQLGLDQADVDRYTTLTQFKKVTAPFDGTITQRRIDVGNLVTAGSSNSTTLLYRLAQDNPIRVFVDVPQNAAGEMKAGVSAEIITHDATGATVQGKITRTADAIDPESRTIKVELDIPNTDHTLVPGMYVDVAFQIPNSGVVEVPAAALVFRPSGPVAAVIDDGNRVEFRKVVIGRDNGNNVEISSGVSLGDKLGLNIGNQIADGETVEPQEFKEPASHAPSQAH